MLRQRGPCNLGYVSHDKTLISHDLLRVEPVQNSMWGWLYAYLRAPQARAMMTGAQYGHIIKHLETGHLDALPVPVVTDGMPNVFLPSQKVYALSAIAPHQLILKAEACFEKAIGPIKIQDWGEGGFSVRASALFSGRRRLEAVPYNPGVSAIFKHLAKSAVSMETIECLGVRVWLPGRFKRIPASEGVELVESSDVFETNPDYPKKIAETDFGDEHNGRVKLNWLLMARSGQTYGINGSIAFATEAIGDRIVSDDLMRIGPLGNAKIRMGYCMYR